MSLACWALSAFCLVMEAISSMEEEVSSSPAACSEAPSARDWLADETCAEAEATCSAPFVIPSTALLMGRVIERVKKIPSPIVTRAPITTPANTMILNRPV